MKNSEIVYAHKRDAQLGGVSTKHGRIRKCELTGEEGLSGKRYLRKNEIELEPEFGSYIVLKTEPSYEGHADFISDGYTYLEDLEIYVDGRKFAPDEEGEYPYRIVDDGKKHVIKLGVKEGSTIDSLAELCISNTGGIYEMDFSNFEDSDYITNMHDFIFGEYPVHIKMGMFDFSNVTNIDNLFSFATSDTAEKPVVADAVIDIDVFDLSSVTSCDDAIMSDTSNDGKVTLNIGMFNLNEYTSNHLLFNSTEDTIIINYEETETPELMATWISLLPANITVTKQLGIA